MADKDPRNEPTLTIEEIEAMLQDSEVDEGPAAQDQPGQQLAQSFFNGNNSYVPTLLSSVSTSQLLQDHGCPAPGQPQQLQPSSSLYQLDAFFEVEQAAAVQDQQQEGETENFPTDEDFGELGRIIHGDQWDQPAAAEDEPQQKPAFLDPRLPSGSLHHPLQDSAALQPKDKDPPKEPEAQFETEFTDEEAAKLWASDEDDEAAVAQDQPRRTLLGPGRISFYWPDRHAAPVLVPVPRSQAGASAERQPVEFQPSSSSSSYQYQQSGALQPQAQSFFNGNSSCVSTLLSSVSRSQPPQHPEFSAQRQPMQFQAGSSSFYPHKKSAALQPQAQGAMVTQGSFCSGSPSNNTLFQIQKGISLKKLALALFHGNGSISHIRIRQIIPQGLAAESLQIELRLFQENHVTLPPNFVQVVTSLLPFLRRFKRAVRGPWIESEEPAAQDLVAQSKQLVVTLFYLNSVYQHHIPLSNLQRIIQDLILSAQGATAAQAEPPGFVPLDLQQVGRLQNIIQILTQNRENGAQFAKQALEDLGLAPESQQLLLSLFHGVYVPPNLPQVSSSLSFIQQCQLPVHQAHPYHPLSSSRIPQLNQYTEPEALPCSSIQGMLELQQTPIRSSGIGDHALYCSSPVRNIEYSVPGAAPHSQEAQQAIAAQGMPQQPQGQAQGSFYGGYDPPDFPPVDSSFRDFITGCSKPFEKQLARTDINGGFLRIFKAHVDDHIKQLMNDEVPRAGFPVRVYDCLAKEYPVEFKWRGHNGYFLRGKGWRDFCRDKGLVPDKDWVTIWAFRHAVSQMLSFVIASRRLEGVTQHIHVSNRKKRDT